MPSLRSLRLAFIIGALALVAVKAQDEIIQPVQGPLPYELVKAKPILDICKDTVKTHGEKVENISSMYFIPEETYKVAGRIHDELNAIAGSLHILDTGLVEPPPWWTANTGPGKIPTVAQIAKDFSEILKSLKKTYDIAVGFMAPDTHRTLSADLFNISGWMTESLNVSIYTLDFDISEDVRGEVDIEAFSQLDYGFPRIATILSDQVTS